MRKRTYIIPSALAGLLRLAAIALFAGRPGMPSSWAGLRVGMTQQEVEVERLEGEGLRGGLNVVQIYKDAPMFGARSQWVLTLEYDGPVNIRGRTVRLISALARFNHTGYAALNSEVKRLL